MNGLYATKVNYDTKRQYGVEPEVYESSLFSYENVPFTKILKMARSELGISAQTIPEILGMNQDIFRGKCRGQRPATRDFVIATCAILLLDSNQTCEALRSHKNMFPGLDESNDRDSLIIHFLDGRRYKRPCKAIVSDLNAALNSEGFLSLDIIDHRGKIKKKEKATPTLSPYIVTGFALQIASMLDYAQGEPFDSLITEYALDRATSIGRLRIKHKETGIVYHLVYSSNGRTELYEEQLSGLSHYVGEFENDKDLEPFFEKLQTRTMEHNRKLILRLDDTRNYGERISARLVDGQLYVFVEKYNYELPEANEYYLMEYINGEYTLSIYHHSAFMHRYLGEKEYLVKVSKTVPGSVLSFRSLCNIDRFAQEKGVPRYQKDLIPSRKRAYRELKAKVDQMRGDLAIGKRFIQDPFVIDFYGGEDPVGWLCWYYKIEKEFNCYYQASDNQCIRKDEASFDLPDGSTVMLSSSELRKAFEVGYQNVQDICRVKHDRGTIDVKY